MRKLTHKEWTAEATAKFGPDPMKWKFVCPSCGHVASTQDWKDAGAKSNEVGIACIGRYLPDRKKAAAEAFQRKGGPCDYAGFGLFRLNPVEVDFGIPGGEPVHVFEFAEPNAPPAP